MNRRLPLWLFLLLMLLGSAFTVANGWTVKTAILDKERRNRLDTLALQVASFPSIATAVWFELLGYARQTYHEDLISVPRGEIDLSGFAPVQTGGRYRLPGLLLRADRAAMAPG